MEAIFAALGVCLFILALCGGYGICILYHFAVYKIRDKGDMTLREFSQDW